MPVPKQSKARGSETTGIGAKKNERGGRWDGVGTGLGRDWLQNRLNIPLKLACKKRVGGGGGHIQTLVHSGSGNH